MAQHPGPGPGTDEPCALTRGGRVAVVASLVVAGTLIGTLGTFVLPIGHGLGHFWPAIAVQVAGGIWFGGWGVLASLLFPIATNALTMSHSAQLLGFIPANAVQALIPAWAFRRFAIDPALARRGDLLRFVAWGAIVPNACGALLGGAALVLWGEVSHPNVWRFVLVWWRANSLAALLLGPLALRVLTPLWREYRVLVKGFWR